MSQLNQAALTLELRRSRLPRRLYLQSALAEKCEDRHRRQSRAMDLRQSPLVDGNLVVCTLGGTEATVVALNRKTGELA